jgi:OPA family glycerol-3-phosphate transporter-like MFS transporter
MVLFGVIGFLVYVPVLFSGMMSLDLTSKKAVGTAAGFVGMFGYVSGRFIQGKGVGWIAQRYGWDAARQSRSRGACPPNHSQHRRPPGAVS